MSCPYGAWRYNYNDDKEYYCVITKAGCCPPSTEDGVKKCSTRFDKEFKDMQKHD